MTDNETGSTAYGTGMLLEAGLGDLGQADATALASVLEERLRIRTGTRITEGLTDEQLDVFAQLAAKDDVAGKLRWLEANAPDFKKYVSEEREKLVAELCGQADEIRNLARSM